MLGPAHPSRSDRWGRWIDPMRDEGSKKKGRKRGKRERKWESEKVNKYGWSCSDEHLWSFVNISFANTFLLIEHWGKDREKDRKKGNLDQSQQRREVQPNGSNKFYDQHSRCLLPRLARRLRCGGRTWRPCAYSDRFWDVCMCACVRLCADGRRWDIQNTQTRQNRKII